MAIDQGLKGYIRARLDALEEERAQQFAALGQTIGAIDELKLLASHIDENAGGDEPPAFTLPDGMKVEPVEG